ncbi:MAG: hypothetical protein IK064_01800, partial [Clostridia bacterium]|nr:hypothetical protein [Clostridia bacterium]
VIIRNETIVSADEFDLADYFAEDGQQVCEGDLVMNVYKMGYSPEITLSLWRTKQEIYLKQLEVLGEARDIELRNYDDSVDEAKKRLCDAVMNGNTAVVLSLQDELTDLLERRSEYLRGYIQETESLRGLYRQEEDWERAVESSRTSLYAVREGRVSYYLDDFAVALNADKLSTVTGDLISAALKANKTARWTGSSRTNAFRIVDTGEWYCAFLTGANEALRITEGLSYPVEIEGYGSFTGVALRSFVSGKNVVNIIKITADMGELIGVRAVTVGVRYAGTDLRVEKRAIQFEDGEPYVEVITPEGRVGVHVNVISEDGNYVIINAKNTGNAPIGAGVKYWIPKRSKK